MALFGRVYTLPTYEQVVIEAHSQEEADKLFEQLERKYRYMYNIARYFLGESDARDGWEEVELVDSFDADQYGWDEPTYTRDEVNNMLKED